MADTFCTPDQYPAVRALVQIGLSPAEIPDEVLDMTPFSPAADAFVLQTLAQMEYPTPPNWTADPNFVAFQSAADYWCAALVATNQPLALTLSSERYDDYSYTRSQTTNYQDRSAWLRYQAQALLLLAIGGAEALAELQPVSFINAPGSPRVYLGF